MNGCEIMQWQKDLKAQPEIWWVEQYDGNDLRWESTGHYYNSELAASLEVVWIQQRKRKARLCSCSIHNLDLSERRWQLSKQPNAGGER